MTVSPAAAGPAARGRGGAKGEEGGGAGVDAAEGAPPRRAAIPMGNPCCSCKLTAGVYSGEGGRGPAAGDAPAAGARSRAPAHRVRPGLPSNTMALITSDCGTVRCLRTKMARITSGLCGAPAGRPGRRRSRRPGRRRRRNTGHCRWLTAAIPIEKPLLQL